MSGFHALDVDVQRNATRFAIETSFENSPNNVMRPTNGRKRPPMTLSQPSIVASLATP